MTSREYKVTAQTAHRQIAWATDDLSEARRWFYQMRRTRETIDSGDRVTGANVTCGDKLILSFAF